MNADGWPGSTWETALRKQSKWRIRFALSAQVTQEWRIAGLEACCGGSARTRTRAARDYPGLEETGLIVRVAVVRANGMQANRAGGALSIGVQVSVNVSGRSYEGVYMGMSSKRSA